MSDEEDKKKWRCDPEQYAMLMRCSAKENMAEWNNWREKNPEIEIWLQGATLINSFLKKANFSDAHCEGAHFWKANCEEANFREAHCEGAKFIQTHCEGADFWKANCEEADFRKAHCEGAEFIRAHCEGAYFREAHCEKADFRLAHCEKADFRLAHCEGADFTVAHLQSTQFSEAFLSEKSVYLKCAIDDATDFSHTNLSSVMMETGKKAKLEQNIRRRGWQGWCELKKRVTLRWLAKTPWFAWLWKHPPILRGLTKILASICLVPVMMVRFFWYVSDYGYSTTRILKWFFGFIGMFAALYTLFPSMLAFTNGDVLNPQGFWGYLGHVIQMIAFATSTMVTLGFSNINVAIEQGQPHFGGMLAVTTNLMVGYFMLAVLVTRLAILFQTLGPGYVVPLPKGKDNDRAK